MPLDYNQRKELNSQISSTGKSIIEKVVIYGLEAVKFVANFIGDMFKQVLGK